MLGRRGAMLVIMGLVYVVLGLGLTLGRPGPHAVRFNLMYTTPAWPWITGWVVTGGIALLYAWRARDWLGWVLLYIMPLITIMVYLAKWILDLTHRTGYYTAWYDAILFTPFIAIVLVCSGWEENSRVELRQ